VYTLTLRGLERSKRNWVLRFLSRFADLDMKVAHLFGMVHPGMSSTSAVRTVFFIDPEMKLRAMIYYPLNVGRNMDEIKVQNPLLFDTRINES